MRLSRVLVLIAACGGSAGPPPSPQPTAIAISAPRGRPDDVVVATVNGRPVWASCVEAQARPDGKTAADVAKAALAECIDFELLAQAAERRGLGHDREVADATRTAMVSELVGKGFEDRYQKPADLADAVAKNIAKQPGRMHRPELRGSTFVRIAVPKHSAADVDQHAHDVADQIAAAFATRTGLYPADLITVADRLASADGKVKLEHADYQVSAQRDVNPEYGTALFAIADVGRTSPATRTEYGWEVVLLTSVVPAHEYTQPEVEAELFPDLRRAEFRVWVNQITRELGVHVAVDPKALEQADQEGG